MTASQTSSPVPTAQAGSPRQAGWHGRWTALRQWRPSRWAWLVFAICLVGLGIRLGYVFTVQHNVRIAGDAFYYHYGANLLADGKGFIQPYDYLLRHKTNASADHPPLYVIVLGVESYLGGRSFTAHQVLSCFIGTSTIALMAVTARRIVSPWAGVVTAIIVAVYPYFWLNDGPLLSEGLAQMTTALAILFAFAFWKRPSFKYAIWLGVAIALAALTRAEAMLLPLLIVVPLALWMKQLSWRRRLALLGVSWLATGFVVAPWIGYNLSRFAKPVYISSGFAPALLSGTCDDAWYGPLRGYWSFKCIGDTPRKYEDISLQDEIYSKKATDYIKAHEGDLPIVELAKIGRLWDWYHPNENVELDAFVETRPAWASRIGTVILYSLQIATIPGILIFRRRKIPLSPLIALFINVTLSAMISFGQTRYRASAEVGLVLFAVAGFDGLREHWKAKRAARTSAPAALPADQTAA